MPRSRNSKYGNKKVVKNGESFDSVEEYKRYVELCLLLRAGQIKDLQRQVEFELVPTQREADTITARGKRKQGKIIERSCSYKADFVYFENDKLVVEDTKGFKTKDYIIKRKLMLYLKGIRIQEL